MRKKKKYKVTYYTKKFKKPKEKIYQKLYYAYIFFKKCKVNSMQPKLYDIHHKTSILFD